MAKLILTPKSDIGRIKQAGQRSAAAPIVPPIPVALLTPLGHDPNFRRQLKRPALKAMSAISTTVKIISFCVADGLGGDGTIGNSPSSQANITPLKSPARIAQLQNALLRKNEIFTMGIMILLSHS